MRLLCVFHFSRVNPVHVALQEAMAQLAQTVKMVHQVLMDQQDPKAQLVLPEEMDNKDRLERMYVVSWNI